MKLWHKAAGGLGLLAAVATGATLMMPAKHKPGQLTRAQFEAGTFPKGVPLGDDQGVMRHEIRLVDKDGQLLVVECHDIPGDFRRADEVTREKWITEHSIKDLTDKNLMACGGPSDFPFRLTDEANAQPHCTGDDCGGGCPVVNCPGTSRVGDGCELGGDTCTVTIVCCSGTCLCS